MELGREMLGALDGLRKNIISWYPFKENSTILQIGVQSEKITNKLSEFAKRVVVISNLKETKQKVESKENIESIAGNPKDVELEEKFDYIILIGAIEYSEQMFKMTAKELISSIKRFLKNDGKLLILTDNKLGINNLCTESRYDGLKLLGRNTIEKILDEEGLVNRKFYYPLPNYIFPNVIFTDAHLPDFETIARSLIFYDENTICALDEIKRFKAILKEEPKMFGKLTNSFFIECSQEMLEENNIEFVAFSNIRKPEYRIQTIIQGENVYKTNTEESSKEHIQNIKRNIDILNQSSLKTVDSYDQNMIISKYQYDVATLDKAIIQKCEDGDIGQAIDLMLKFKEHLENNLQNVANENNVFDKYNIEYKKEDIENLHFVKYGLWDLIFKNCFYIDNNFYFYDQEWLEENLPIEFIIFRAILYFPELTKFIQNEDAYRELGITENQIKVFKSLDDILQNKIRDEVIWNVHSNVSKNSVLVEKVKNLEKDKEKILEDCKKLLIEKDGRIKVLEDGMQGAMDTIKKQETAIAGMVNSTSWKLTRPLRKIKGIIKGNNKKGE